MPYRNNNDIILPAPNKLLTTHNSDDDKLVAFLLGKLERTDLSPKLEEKLENMNVCADLIRKYGSRVKVTRILQTNHDISRATAYRLFDDTQRIFGVSQVHDQQFWVDVLLGSIMEDIRLARTKQDFRAVASLTRVMKDTIKEFLGSADASLYERIQPPKPVLGFFPDELKNPDIPKDDDELKKLIREFKKKKKDKLYSELASDTTYEPA